MRSREQFLLLQGGAAWNCGPWQGRRRNPRRPELGFFLPAASCSVCDLSARDFTARNRVFIPWRTRLFFHQAQRRMPSLWLGWWRRGEDDSGFEQKFAYPLPDKIAHPGGGDIPCEQLDGMRPRPFWLLVGTLTAGPTAEDWRPAAGTDLEPLFADQAPRSFAPPPFWSSGCHPEGPSMHFATHYASDEIGTSWSTGCGTECTQLRQPTRRENLAERSCRLPNFITVSMFLQGNGIHAWRIQCGYI